MAQAFNPEQKLENIKVEVIRAFDELYQSLSNSVVTPVKYEKQSTR